MKRNCERLFQSLVALFLFMPLTSTFASGPRYTITDLGTLGDRYSYAEAIGNGQGARGRLNDRCWFLDAA